MASFFKRGKKIILTVEKDEIKDGGTRLLSALKEALPIEADHEVLLNMAACEHASVEAVSVLTSFGRDVRKAGSHLHVTVAKSLHVHFTAIGLDRHFTLLSAESKA